LSTAGQQFAKTQAETYIGKQYYPVPENSSRTNSLLFSLLLEAVTGCNRMGE